MEKEIRERSVEVDGMTLTLLHKDGKWVSPLSHITSMDSEHRFVWHCWRM